MDSDKSIMSCVHHYGITQNSFTILKNPLHISFHMYYFFDAQDSFHDN